MHVTSKRFLSSSWRSGTRKAGIFKENVLIELLISVETITEHEQQYIEGFPETFKTELKEYIGQLNLKENNQ